MGKVLSKTVEDVTESVEAFVTDVRAAMRVGDDTRLIELMEEIAHEAEADRRVVEVIVNHRGIAPIVALAYNESEEVILATLHAITALGKTGCGRRALIEENVLEPLYSLARAPHHAIQLHVTSVLALIVEGSDDATHEDVLRRALYLFVLLARSTSELVQEQAARGLSNISRHGKTRALVAKEGGLAALVGFLRSRFPRVQRYAVRAMADFALNESNQVKLVKEGGLRPLFQILSSRDPNTRQDAGQTLARLAENEENRMKMVSDGALEVLMPLFSSWVVSDQRVAISTLANLALDVRNQRALVAVGFLESALKLARSRDPIVRAESIRAVANFSLHVENKETLEGAMHSTIKMLRKSEDLDVQREAIRFLAILAENERMQREIFDSPGLSRLIELSNAGEEGLQAVLAYLISNFCYEREFFHHFVARGLLTWLEDWMAARAFDAWKWTARAISILITAAPEFRSRLGAVSIIKRLLTLVSCDDALAQIWAIESLVGLSERSDNQLKIVTAGAVEMLLARVIRKTRDRELEYQGLALLANLTQNSDAHQSIMHSHVLQPLLRLMTVPNMAHRREATRAIAHLTNSTANKVKIAHSGAIRHLVDILKDAKEPECQQWAARAISNLSLLPRNRAKIIQDGALPPLIALTLSPHIAVQIEGCRAIVNLA